MRLGPGWRRLFRLRDPERHLRDEAGVELQFHLDGIVGELRADGMSPEEARTEALRRFGDPGRIEAQVASLDHRRVRKKRLGVSMGTFWQDIAYAVRTLRHNAGFATVSIFTVALGIGANTAIFSVVDAVLLRQLPYQEPDRLVMVWLDNTVQGFHEDLTSYPNFTALASENETLQSLAAFTTGGFTLVGDGEPERLRGAIASAEFFNIMGVTALYGRTFVAGDDVPGDDRIVLLSHGLWQRRFGADQAIVGSTIVLNGTARTVIGVMPPGFRFPQDVDLWTPLAPSENQRNARNSLWLWTVGRLQPDATVQQARADLGAVMKRLEEDYPNSNTGYAIAVNSLHAQLVGDVRQALLVLMGAVAFVLLIACANVANLGLARAAARESEMAMRVALGATHGRIVRQLLTEAGMVALSGAAIGILLASVGIDVLVALAPEDIPRLDEVSLNWSVFGFTIALSAAAAVLFGLAPAVHAARPNIAAELQGGSSRLASPQHAMRRALVVSEMAFALVLLVGAGLMMKSLRRLQDVGPGFASENVLTLDMTLSSTRHPNSEDVSNFYMSLVERLAGLPGVQSAGAASDILVSEFPRSGGFNVEGRPEFALNETVEVLIDGVTPDYFAVMDVPLMSGRFFDRSDAAGQPLAILINKTMAERFWPGQDPVGQRITYGSPDSTATWRTIVGVVGNMKRTGLDREVRAATYLPVAQVPFRALSVVLRTEIPPLDVAQNAKDAVWELDAEQPITAVATMDQRLAERIAQRRFNMVLLAIFAGVALLLAMAGIYGVLAYVVTQRAREIGVRLALGAQRGDILRLVLSQGMSLAGIGVGIGVLGALALGRFISSLLFGVSATDGVTFGTVAALLLSIALVACLIPANRATKVDSMTAIREE